MKEEEENTPLSKQTSGHILDEPSTQADKADKENNELILEGNVDLN